jgi:hypothetical protein
LCGTTGQQAKAQCGKHVFHGVLPSDFMIVEGKPMSEC